MYTFGILAAFFFLLTGVIFGKKIRSNQFLAISIIFLGTFIGSIISNGILGLKIKPVPVIVKSKVCKVQTSEIITTSDTSVFLSFLEFKYQENPDSTVKNRRVDVGYSHDYFYKKDKDRLIVSFLPEGDTVPYFDIIRYERIPNNNWVSKIGLPKVGSRIFHVYLPNDSIHNVLVNDLNLYYYEKTEKIAKLN